MTKALLNACVEPGMFSNERSVRFISEGRHYSFLCDKSNTVGEDRVAVQVLEADDHHAVVALPGECFSGGSRARVPRSMLLPARAA